MRRFTPWQAASEPPLGSGSLKGTTMGWKTWLYQAQPLKGLSCGGATREKTAELADAHHAVVHTYFINNIPPMPYTHAGSVDSGHRLVLAHSDGYKTSTIGVYLVVAAPDVGLPKLSDAEGLRGTGHDLHDCWVKLPAELMQETDHPVDPFLHTYCGIAVQRIHGARVPAELLSRAIPDRDSPRQSLNPWPIEEHGIKMLGEE